jgi:hypothetical protein
MTKMLAIVLLICSGLRLLAVQDLPNDHENVLLRRYREGEKLTYHMKGINEDWHYDIQADGLVRKDPAGTFFEEYHWSNLVSDHQNVALSSADMDFRQQLSLDLNRNPALPNLSQVEPRLVGPITDLMTFYADLWLAQKTGKLVHAGDHFYFKRSVPSSWADGNYVLIGEDSIDFDFTLKDVNRSENIVTLIVRHVPPDNPGIRIPVDWMKKPVTAAPNNWVQVRRTKNGKYLSAVGKETFDVEMKLSLIDGKILSGSIDNPVETIERECDDASLTTCRDPRPHSIRRKIQISLER